MVSVEGADFHVNKYIYGVSSDAKKSVELRMNDGGIRLKRDTTANAGNTNGYIDFASEHEPSTYGRLQYNDRANVFAF